MVIFHRKKGCFIVAFIQTIYDYIYTYVPTIDFNHPKVNFYYHHDGEMVLISNDALNWAGGCSSIYGRAAPNKH